MDKLSISGPSAFDSWFGARNPAAGSLSSSIRSLLEGRMGALLGDEVVYAEKGDLVFKPRDQWHTFWNAGDGPFRILEIISPGGFEHVFKEMAEDPDAMAGETASALDARYGIEADYDSIERLCEEHGLNFPVEG
jgi:Cupin domain